ncbi:MAG TPA: RNA polymerase sigma factor [Burkholderiales bacterium]|nr:RNA polymerase sigma factor [Burkholderiales bacterium]
MADVPDPMLVERALDGDSSAFEAVMRRNNRQMFRVARAVLRDDAEAEDALQVAYLAAYQALGSYRADSRLSTWLTRIVLNESLMRLRKRRRESNVIVFAGTDDEGDSSPVERAVSAAETPDAAAARAEVRRLIERHIDALPNAFRTVFVLRGVEELTVEETAASLDLPEATVRTRFFRARSLLRESLAREADIGMADAFGFEGARCDRIVAAVLAALPPPDTT